MGKQISLYPLKFVPILKEKVWGGNKLNQLLGKEGKGNIGESWEISGVDGNASIVANGPLANASIAKLISDYKVDLLGSRVYKKFGENFPLLFKFIDAREDLSVQLHPDDDLAGKRHSSFGKTEMWYVIQADKDSRIIIGFNQKVNETQYQKSITSKSITAILHSEEVTKGDAFFIGPGTVHAIGAGVLLAEIQQSSDITYRIYDWDRPGTDGKLRELHQDLAMEAINFNTHESRLTYLDSINEPILLKSHRYFETNKLNVNTIMHRDLSNIDSFVVYMCVEGEAIIKCNKNSVEIKAGETVLIPASISGLELVSKNATFLEVYIP